MGIYVKRTFNIITADEIDSRVHCRSKGLKFADARTFRISELTLWQRQNVCHATVGYQHRPAIPIFRPIASHALLLTRGVYPYLPMATSAPSDR